MVIPSASATACPAVHTLILMFLPCPFSQVWVRTMLFLGRRLLCYQCVTKKYLSTPFFFPWKSKKVVNHRFFLHESTGAFDCVWSRSWYIYTLRGDWLWDLHVYTRRRKQSYRCGSSGWKGEHELVCWCRRSVHAVVWCLEGGCLRSRPLVAVLVVMWRSFCHGRSSLVFIQHILVIRTVSLSKVNGEMVILSSALQGMKWCRADVFGLTVTGGLLELAVPLFCRNLRWDR